LFSYSSLKGKQEDYKGEIRLKNNSSVTPEISIVIPVYNEEDHIDKSIKIIETHIKKATENYEIILIDDGSTDRTFTILNKMVKVIPKLHVLKLSRNFGKEFALCAGLENASGDAVLIMDADLQHPPDLIKKMVDVWRKQNVDIVEGVKRSRGKESLRNRAGASVFYGSLKLLTGYNLHGNSDFKLLDRKVVHAWSQLPERNTFFRGMTAWLGFNKVQVEFDVSERVDGHSKWSLVNLIKLALSAVVSFTSLPLRFVSLTGVIFFIAAFLLSLHTLYQKLIGNALTGFTTVILLLLIIGSVMMISLGIIGEYIAAIYNEVKGRPRYLVQHSLKSNVEQKLTEKIYEEKNKVNKYVE
jgi:polyisoprenyl-phosphate glycosyltransferase